MRIHGSELKMANIVVTMKIMPQSPDVNLKWVAGQASRLIKDFAGSEVGKVEEEPIAFGLKALKLYFVMDESKGSTQSLEEKIAGIAGVSSVEVVDVRRTIG